MPTPSEIAIARARAQAQADADFEFEQKKKRQPSPAVQAERTAEVVQDATDVADRFIHTMTGRGPVPSSDTVTQEPVGLAEAAGKPEEPPQALGRAAPRQEYQVHPWETMKGMAKGAVKSFLAPLNEEEYTDFYNKVKSSRTREALPAEFRGPGAEALPPPFKPGEPISVYQAREKWRKEHPQLSLKKHEEEMVGTHRDINKGPKRTTWEAVKNAAAHPVDVGTDFVGNAVSDAWGLVSMLPRIIAEPIVPQPVPEGATGAEADRLTSEAAQKRGQEFGEQTAKGLVGGTAGHVASLIEHPLNTMYERPISTAVITSPAKEALTKGAKLTAKPIEAKLKETLIPFTEERVPTFEVPNPRTPWNEQPMVIPEADIPAENIAPSPTVKQRVAKALTTPIGEMTKEVSDRVWDEIEKVAPPDANAIKSGANKWDDVVLYAKRRLANRAAMKDPRVQKILEDVLASKNAAEFVKSRAERAQGQTELGFKDIKEVEDAIHESRYGSSIQSRKQAIQRGAEALEQSDPEAYNLIFKDKKNEFMLENDESVLANDPFAQQLEAMGREQISGNRGPNALAEPFSATQARPPQAVRGLPTDIATVRSPIVNRLVKANPMLADVVDSTYSYLKGLHEKVGTEFEVSKPEFMDRIIGEALSPDSYTQLRNSKIAKRVVQSITEMLQKEQEANKEANEAYEPSVDPETYAKQLVTQLQRGDKNATLAIEGEAISIPQLISDAVTETYRKDAKGWRQDTVDQIRRNLENEVTDAEKLKRTAILEKEKARAFGGQEESLNALAEETAKERWYDANPTARHMLNLWKEPAEFKADAARWWNSQSKGMKEKMLMEEAQRMGDPSLFTSGRDPLTGGPSKTLTPEGRKVVEAKILEDIQNEFHENQKEGPRKNAEQQFNSLSPEEQRMLIEHQALQAGPDAWETTTDPTTYQTVRLPKRELLDTFRQRVIDEIANGDIESLKQSRKQFGEDVWEKMDPEAKEALHGVERADQLANRVAGMVQAGKLPPQIIPSDIGGKTMRDPVRAIERALRQEADMDTWANDKGARRRFLQAADDIAHYVELKKDVHGVDGWANPLFAETLKWENEVSKAAVPWLSELTGRYKRGVTAKSLISGFNNMMSNTAAQMLRRGKEPFTYTADALGLLGKYEAWKKGKVSNPDDVRFFENVERSGGLSTDALTNDFKEATNIKGVNELLESSLNAVDKLTGGPQIEWIYQKMSDNLAKLKEMKDIWDTTQSYAKKLKDGESMTLPVSETSSFKVTKLGEDKYSYTRVYADGKMGETKIGDGMHLDAIITEFAKKDAGDLFVDFTKGGRWQQWLKNAPLVGAKSSFYTWLAGTLDIPGIKKGIMGRIITGPSELRLETTSPEIIRMQTAELSKLAAKRAFIVNSLQGSEKEKEIARAIQFAPSDEKVALAKVLGDPSYIETTTFGNWNYADSSLKFLRGVAQLASMAGGPWTEEGKQAQAEKALGIVKNEKGEFVEAKPSAQNAELRKRLEAIDGGKNFTGKEFLELVGLSGDFLKQVIDKVDKSAESGQVFSFQDAVEGIVLPTLLGGTQARLATGLEQQFFPQVTQKLDTGLYNEDQKLTQDTTRWWIRRMMSLGWKSIPADQIADTSKMNSYYSKVGEEWKASIGVDKGTIKKYELLMNEAKDKGDTKKFKEYSFRVNSMEGLADAIDDEMDQEAERWLEGLKYIKSPK